MRMAHMRFDMFGGFTVQPVGKMLDRIPVTSDRSLDDFLRGTIQGLALRGIAVLIELKCPTKRALPVPGLTSVLVSLWGCHCFN